jgi:hypothetical protein
MYSRTTDQYEDKLEALRQQRARQDQTLAEAARQLQALGSAPVTVSRKQLEAIDAACLVRVSTLKPTAIRG